MRTKKHRIRAAISATVVAAAVLGCPGDIRADEIRTADPFPTKGRPTAIFVETSEGRGAAGVEVVALYRPESEVELTETVGMTDGRGQVSWAPQHAGIARLTAAWLDSAGEHSATHNVSVKFSGVRADGIAVAILAGLILYGTVAYGFGRLRS